MPHELHPVGTKYRVVLQPVPGLDANQFPHLVTFMVTGHRLVKGIDGVVEVVEATEKRTLTLAGERYE